MHCISFLHPFLCFLAYFNIFVTMETIELLFCLTRAGKNAHKGLSSYTQVLLF